MQGWVDLVGLVPAEVVYPLPPKTVTHPSTHRAQRWVTSFLLRTTLPQRYITKQEFAKSLEPVANLQATDSASK